MNFLKNFKDKTIMSGRIKMIKQRNVSVSVDETHDLSQIRTKFKYDGPSIKDWVLSLPTNEKEGEIIPTSVTFFKDPNPLKPSEKPLPTELQTFVDYMLEEKRIPVSEVRGYSFHVIKPATQVEKISSTKEITFQQCYVYVSDRFILTEGSPELLTYRIIDIRRMTASMGLGPNQQAIENIEEQIKSKDVIHMDIQAAIAMRIIANNKSCYPRPDRKGFKKGVKISKDPMNRFIVILDIIATSDKVENVLRAKTEMISNIMDSKPESQQAKMIRSFNNSLPAEAKEESTVFEDEKVPELVAVDKEGNASVFIEDVDDEVLDNL